MKDARPMNLNLFTIHFPLPAITSILHRISGVILFLLIPFAIWGLDLSLNSYQDFETVSSYLSTPLIKFIFWLIWLAFSYHFVAGIRHLLMDLHIGEQLKSGWIGALLTIIITAVLAIIAGVWLW